MKFITLITLLSLSFTCFAQKWEYKVVFVKGIAGGAEIVEDASGAYIDKSKTEALNKLAKKGWELVAVTGASGADHSLYLKRPFSKENLKSVKD